MAAGDPGSPARYFSSIAVETSLQSSIPAQAQGSSNSSFIVESVSGFPTSCPYTLIVDPDTSKEEVLTVTSGSSTTLVVTRGVDGTQGVAHSAGAVVRHGVSGRDFRESQNHIAARGWDIDEAILVAANQTHVHGIAVGDGVIVGTNKEQTLNNKTIGANGLKFEGSTTNAFDTTLNVVDPTANRAITFPDTSGTVTINDAAQTLSNKTLGSNLAAGTFKITGLGDPTVAQDAATKNYVDTGVSSGVAQAAASAAAAATSATSASNSATAAATSASSAAASASASASSASASATSATAAATSATSAANSATAAATSATSAANSATAAATSATSAAASATAAASSATTAAASVATIAGYAAAAATSEANALTSANSAATSAASAAASTSAAAASASAAATSATSAANSATAAATSATSAANSATAAATSATSATASATLANDWATLMTGPVAGGEYSAKYNAGLAATSATSAATSASSAATSATAAATSAASAATSATSAAASYDQFDDRYLGDKSSDPTVDNDGNPLLTGALYFNTVVGAMKVYDGSAWDLVAPDTSNFIDKSVLSGKGALLGASAASTPFSVTPASTNGYILTIDSATTSGLAWVAPNPGDITAVTAGSGLTGGGTSGDVTLAVSSDVLRTTGGQVISANTSANALEIRQIGTGNALYIEDSTNPDATPFAVTTDGLIWIGNQTDVAGVTERGVVVTDENTTGAVFVGRKSSTNTFTNASLILAKSGGTAASPTAVVNNEYIGSVLFSGFDGTNYSPAAQILGAVNGAPGVGDMPGMLWFLTSADGTASPVERMRIDSAGNVNIGTNGSVAAGGTNTQGLSINGQDVELMTIMGAWI